MASAAPSTTSSAAPVIISRAPEAASRRNIGLSSHLLTATRPSTPASPAAIASSRSEPASAGPGDSTATSASRGTMARSSSSSTDITRCRLAMIRSPRSSSTCMTMAVDESTKPMPAISATPGFKPQMKTPAAVSAAPQTTTCVRPSPKICRRMFHSRDGCISRPITNRNITTPSSAICRIVCGSRKKARPNGPIATPAAR